MRWFAFALALRCADFALWAAPPAETGALAREYLQAMLRIDSTNPPGNETRVAKYLKQVAEREGIPALVIGGDPARMNFVARLRGSGRARPLLLMAHTDVVPADSARWTVGPFSGEIRDGYLYGRGAQDDKNLLAAEMAVLVALKRSGVKLARDVIVLGEADEEAGSTGMRWMVENAWSAIDAEFALNEGGGILHLASGERIFQIQTAEKIPTRVTLVAHGTSGHAALPLPDNPVVSLARAILRLNEADQPVRLNETTRRYLGEMARLKQYAWLAPLLPSLEDPGQAVAAANEIRARNREFDALLRTTISPTILTAGSKVNVIPDTAQAQIDIRRAPGETREEVLERVRRAVNDSAIEIVPARGPGMPPTAPSSLGTALYRALEGAIGAAYPGSAIVPYMSKGATDGALLRARGVAVYGAPVFMGEPGESRAHGNDERIALSDLDAGAALLWKIVMQAARE
jgi:acetylornithine deacetylase/succinyl-diaminopimelate desuccinylase-like protein